MIEKDETEDSRMSIQSAHRAAKRISVIGITGSGKTYVARRLAAITGLPLHELDSVKRDTSGSELGDHLFSERVLSLVENDSWIIEGHYRSVRDAIWNRSDQIIWLDIPLHMVAMQILSRRLQASAPALQTRNSSPSNAKVRRPGWAHRASRWSRSLKEKKLFAKLFADADRRNVVRLRSRKEVSRFIEDSAGSSVAQS